MATVLLHAFEASRGTISRIRHALTTDDKIDTITESHENTMCVLEVQIMSQQSLENAVAELQKNMRNQGQHKKSFADSLCISNLRT